MTAAESRSVLRRFVLLRGSRWFPTGLLIPVIVLFLVDRGLSLAEVGIVIAAQGIVVLILELPTGGLADAIGRRRVLLIANGFEIASLALLLIGGSLVWFAGAFAIQGVFRALESGPLDAWYVDAAQETDPTADVERGLSRAGVVLGLSVAAGAAISGGLVAIDPFPSVDALALPFLAALTLRLVDTALIAWLMTEIRAPLGRPALLTAVGEVPSIISATFRLARSSTVLSLLVGVELFWGFGMGTFETLFPARLGDLLGTADQAAAAMGPIAAFAWVASAGGAAAVSWFSRRMGPHAVAAAMRVLQGATIVGMGAFGGMAGLVSAYLMCFVIHGAANPVHMALLHDEADSSNRTTVLSLNSMAAMTSGAVGGIALGAIADRAGIATGMYVGAVIIAVAAPLYLIAGRRQAQQTPPVSVS